MPIFDPKMFDEDASTERDFTPAKPGEYPFIVDEAVSRTREKGNQYRSGNEGVALTLLVGAFDDRDIPVYVHLVNSPKAAWKVKEFCNSIGLDPTEVDAAREFVGKGGKATFENDEKGYLVAKKFLPLEVVKPKKEEKQQAMPF